jgi:hypothetical protein
VKGRFIGSVYGCREAAIAMVWTNALEAERGEGREGAGNKKKEISLGRRCDTKVPRFVGRGNT